MIMAGINGFPVADAIGKANNKPAKKATTLNRTVKATRRASDFMPSDVESAGIIVFLQYKASLKRSKWGALIKKSHMLSLQGKRWLSMSVKSTQFNSSENASRLKKCGVC